MPFRCTKMNFFNFQMATSEAGISSIRGELELVQRALKLQTRRCRQLVAEYTKRLQLKEQQYQAEKRLRDDQLARVLRALLMFEARLKQEQKFISHQLEEKDYAIKKQQTDIQKLLSNHYCKNCNQYYNPSSNLESLDSSSEYVVTDYHDYQSSNFESLDSSSETYASISERDCEPKQLFPRLNPSISSEDNIKTDSDAVRSTFMKNKNKDSLGRRARRIVHRKSVGNYFEVLKMRTGNHSPSSNDENTSNDYENFDSLPLSENLKSKIGTVSERIERIFVENSNKFDGSADEHNNSDSVETSSNATACNTTVIINKNLEDNDNKNNLSTTKSSNSDNLEETKGSKISETIPVFEGDGDTNDNWYASASDQEDEEQRDFYRNNPVLECMNQILMQNINDPMNSPPKTPNMEKKCNRNNKRVKFSDEEDNKSVKENKTNSNESESDYYETPIQRTPNFYETPQSIYSNDYEQILSQCNETFVNKSKENSPKSENAQEKEINSSLKKLSIPTNKSFESLEQSVSHYYVDMDTKSEKEEKENNKIIRKSKILRTPPALPPKPANLMSKYKIQSVSPLGFSKDRLSEKSLDSEPDYCSISEINLPTTDKNGCFTKINVVAEINSPNIEPIQKRSSLLSEKNILSHSQQVEREMPPSPPQYKPVSLNEPIPSLNSAKKNSIQTSKQNSSKLDNATPKKAPSPEIPKLPQVTEIIIPEENESKQDECISHDNYVKNNTQILKQKNSHTDRTRPAIQMGSTVSSLIASFNNKQLLSEIKQKPTEKHKLNRRMFSSFENLQNLETHSYPEQSEQTPNNSFENFDLSQNFEEFKLDDCEIEDYNENYSDVGSRSPPLEAIKKVDHIKRAEHKMLPGNLNFCSSTRVELVRATNDLMVPQLNINSLQQLKKKIELEKNRACINNQIKHDNVPMTATHCNEPTYEHFLECTGLSSKSILTPSRLLSNHKSMLKPKDVKLRSKVKSNNVFERQGSTVKYWSEPYL